MSSPPRQNPASPGKGASSPGGASTSSPRKATTSSSGVYIPTSPTDGEAIMPANRPATPDAENETRYALPKPPGTPNTTNNTGSPPLLPPHASSVDTSAYETADFRAAQQLVLAHQHVGRMTTDAARTYTLRAGGPLPVQSEGQVPTPGQAMALAAYMRDANYDVRTVVHDNSVWLFVAHTDNRAEDEAFWIQEISGHAFSELEVKARDAARTWGR
ncbi:uncharacterized protein BDZ99DRAFT_474415 [Mytilinidion resinicola]|uniref:Uncharacterized protein n=1 Tax=Mytilinidion resinicola TaxID=574789 RepID=A0A6A6YTC7_9PEZI|nr:uncharacterized protein BDZ99DRAFT_474415 [Mytilinidion resinicola]KAF2812206.1 hypothetical protein BDZ99DRAFT_474415 [Mytilinidion resinicola]